MKGGVFAFQSLTPSETYLMYTCHSRDYHECQTLIAMWDVCLFWCFYNKQKFHLFPKILDIKLINYMQFSIYKMK